MKTLTGSLLAAALIALAHPALSNPNVEEVVVTAKQPAAEMLSDMTDEIVAETSAELFTIESMASRRRSSGSRRSSRSAF